MKGLLVRVAIDQSYGHWNAPVDPDTNEFVYVPIPEARPQSIELETTYQSHIPSLKRFCNARNLDLDRDLKFPKSLHTLATHLDPDFQNLTYGDVGDKRGSQIVTMGNGDIVAFYAGLKPIKPCQHKLLYAIIGLYVIDEVVMAGSVVKERWRENAHTRRQDISARDVIIRAMPGLSGLLERCVVIGEYRDKAYRVTKDILKAWGGLSVTDGYIQRCAVPPMFLDAAKFLRWYKNICGQQPT